MSVALSILGLPVISHSGKTFSVDLDLSELFQICRIAKPPGSIVWRNSRECLWIPRNIQCFTYDWGIRIDEGALPTEIVFAVASAPLATPVEKLVLVQVICITEIALWRCLSTMSAIVHINFSAMNLQRITFGALCINFFIINS